VLPLSGKPASRGPTLPVVYFFKLFHTGVEVLTIRTAVVVLDFSFGAADFIAGAGTTAHFISSSVV